MLFNLSKQSHFPNKRTGKEIYCHSNYGPCFSGDGSSELSAYGEPFNGDNKCRSFANGSGYKIPLVDGKNMLTNEEDGRFTITELEVWQVKFLVIFNFKLILYRTEQDETQKEERERDRKRQRQRENDRQRMTETVKERYHR